MAESAVKFLQDNLKELLSCHIHLIADAKHELEKLEEDLRYLKIFLYAYANIFKNEELFIEWERQAKKAVYEVEDAVDCYVQKHSHISSLKKVVKYLRKKKHQVWDRDTFKDTSSSLKKEVNYLREKKMRPVIDKFGIVFANIPLRDAFDTYAEEVFRRTRGTRNKAFRGKNVVGFEDETNKLINCLSKESNKLEVICITGMSGIGKTTLARKIYCDPTIQYKFPTLIWISSSQDNNIKDVLLTILKKFTQLDMSPMSVDDLAKSVHEYLVREKFLIFIDDVRTVDAWTKIQAFLPKSNEMGKVLITSHFEKVASHASLKSNRHELQLQDQKKSWEILQFEVFGKFKYPLELEHVEKYMTEKYMTEKYMTILRGGFPLPIKGTFKCPPELEHVGKCMANLCGGLPIAIKLIGGVLANTFSREENIESEWRKLYDHLKTYLLQGEEDNEERLEIIISWSYYKLPYNLRDCFLYLGMFPKDTEIPALKLTKLWIAEGFVSGHNLEETAQDNLKDLISRNLVIVEKTNLYGEVKTCLIHDTIREFCQKIARYEDQNLFEELRKSKEGAIEPPMRKLQKFRRLCIHSYDHDFFLKTKGVSHVRSFLSFSKTINLENKDNSSIIDSFELLRVFDVNAKFLKFPAKFTQLVHLRYLSLSGDKLEIVPEAISQLWNLQTLTVHTLSHTLEVKANIWKLFQLRHVKTKAAIILDNLGRAEGGENLQTLTRLSPQICTNDVFDKAKNLKTLGIRGSLNKIIHSNCLEKLELLEKLKLVHDVYPLTKSENPLQDIPLRFPPNIRVLTLSATYLNWASMSTLGKHSTLKVLKLKDNAFVGDYWDAVPEGFHQLEFLSISRTDLQVWKASNDSFPKLRSLVLENCEKLEGVPTEICMNLEMLSLTHVTEHLVLSAIQIKEKRDTAKEQKETKWGELELIIAPGDAPLDHKY